MNDVLQCTAVTLLPFDDVPAALTATLEDGPAPGSYLLCDLGEHDERTEHAAHLRSAETPSAPALWFFWTGSGADRVHRVATAPWCPALLHHLRTGVVQRCAFFDRHAAPHSWSVTDPLGDLIAARLVSDDDPDAEPDDDPDDPDDSSSDRPRP
ncbi:hypothetical protein ACIP6P_01465 [Streptomyces sp. NPDC088729]|uniref:hypothetical protein n=1 Tax=Streptomyces sp. NPDC088729 TaxID=3365876 RepID=UPI003810F3E2